VKFSARILASLSFCHLLNDLMQSLLPSIYPMLKQAFGLSFRQIGLITLVSQITASLLQPAIGLYTDRRPQPHSLAVGMAFTLVGIVLLRSEETSDLPSARCSRRFSCCRTDVPASRGFR